MLSLPFEFVFAWNVQPGADALSGEGFQKIETLNVNVSLDFVYVTGDGDGDGGRGWWVAPVLMMESDVGATALIDRPVC